jgi:hypothetical protein
MSQNAFEMAYYTQFNAFCLMPWTEESTPTRMLDEEIILPGYTVVIRETNMSESVPLRTNSVAGPPFKVTWLRLAMLTCPQ